MVAKKIKKQGISIKNKVLENVPPDNNFFVCNGHVLRNIRELCEELRAIDEGSYPYHVNQEKNDFSNWVNDILKDKKLADDLRMSIKKEDALEIVEKRVKTLTLA